MDVFAEISPLRKLLNGHRGRRRIALVPTMGALHAGHRSCVDTARAVDDALVVVSIYVNPAQFDAGEDLDRYPRPIDQDLALCREWGADVVFAPGDAQMYPAPQQSWVEVEGVSEPLCGRARPGHFRGMATVVAKLFNIVVPDVAVFGQKDAQQALVIRQMTRQLDMTVELRVARTVRETDGLAMSSRNARLDAESRVVAAAIHGALLHAGTVLSEGERDPGAVERSALDFLGGHGIDDVEYSELLDAGDLSALGGIEGRVILAIAARLSGVRLIDNMVYDVGPNDVTVDVTLY